MGGDDYFVEVGVLDVQFYEERGVFDFGYFGGGEEYFFGSVADMGNFEASGIGGDFDHGKITVDVRGSALGAAG